MNAYKPFQIADVSKLKGLPKLLCPNRFLLVFLAIGEHNIINIEDNDATGLLWYLIPGLID